MGSASHARAQHHMHGLSITCTGSASHARAQHHMHGLSITCMGSASHASHACRVHTVPCKPRTQCIAAVWLYHVVFQCLLYCMSARVLVSMVGNCCSRVQPPKGHLMSFAIQRMFCFSLSAHGVHILCEHMVELVTTSHGVVLHMHHDACW